MKCETVENMDCPPTPIRPSVSELKDVMLNSDRLKQLPSNDTSWSASVGHIQTLRPSFSQLNHFSFPSRDFPQIPQKTTGRDVSRTTSTTPSCCWYVGREVLFGTELTSMHKATTCFSSKPRPLCPNSTRRFTFGERRFFESKDF